MHAHAETHRKAIASPQVSRPVDRLKKPEEPGHRATTHPGGARERLSEDGRRALRYRA